MLSVSSLVNSMLPAIIVCPKRLTFFYFSCIIISELIIPVNSSAVQQIVGQQVGRVYQSLLHYKYDQVNETAILERVHVLKVRDVIST